MNDDPGWPSLRLFMIPGSMQRYRRKHPDAGALFILRGLFMSFFAAIALYGFVLLFINPFLSDAIALCAAAVVVYGLAVITIVPRVEKPLPCDAGTIVGAYRTRFFLRIAAGESIGLLAFVLSFTAGNLVYFAGAVLSLAAMWRAAPTQAALQREQQELGNRGCGVDLVAALIGPPYTR